MKVIELLNRLDLKLDIPEVILELDLGDDLIPIRFSEEDNVYNIFCKRADGNCKIIINFNNIEKGSFLTFIDKFKNHEHRPFVAGYTYGGGLCCIS